MTASLAIALSALLALVLGVPRYSDQRHCTPAAPLPKRTTGRSKLQQ